MLPRQVGFLSMDKRHCRDSCRNAHLTAGLQAPDGARERPNAFRPPANDMVQTNQHRWSLRHPQPQKWDASNRRCMRPYDLMDVCWV